MPKTSYYNFRLTRLFAPNDEYSATIARLCILWEDFITEASGGAAGKIQEMDGHSPQWRRLYFLRRSVGTVHEIRKALHTLQINNEFKETLSKQPEADQISFEDSYRKLIQHEAAIKTLRNNIAGGHVLQGAVMEGLSKANPELHGMLQSGEYYKDIRFKFAHGLVLATMFPGHASKDAEEEVERFITLMDEATSSALKLIQYTFSFYMKQRHITPL
jgi:hypothetical protein